MSFPTKRECNIYLFCTLLCKNVSMNLFFYLFQNLNYMSSDTRENRSGKQFCNFGFIYRD